MRLRSVGSATTPRIDLGSSRTYRTHVIVLDKVKLKETDLILTLLSESGKQIRAVGKGARKPGSRLAARCELFCLSDLLLAHGRALDVVSQAELLEAPLGVDVDFDLISAASAVTELAKHCSYEDVEDPFVFSITKRALEIIGSGLDSPHQDLIVAAYAFKLLSHVGYRPDFSGCVACGDEQCSFFSAQAGGLLCASCAVSVPGAERVDAATVGWLRAIMALRFDELTAAAIDPNEALLLLALAHVWSATHLDCRLRALEFMLGR